MVGTELCGEDIDRRWDSLKTVILTQRGPLGSGPGEGGGCRKEGNRVKSLSPLPWAAHAQARGELS